MPRDLCPICDRPVPNGFLYRRAVPVHQNVPFPTATAARAIARGDLDMRACSGCGFVFNAAFDPRLLDYGPAYENSQDHSGAFVAHLNELVERVVEAGCARTGTIVEVGCGKGQFLTRLCSHPKAGCSARGFDPSYIGPEEALGGRVRFVPAFYGPDTTYPADAVLCRHVIEHIAEPLELLRDVRAALSNSAGAHVFFETPCAEWILDHRVPWDFFYEHCSLFTSASLALALRRTGFGVRGVAHVFGGQYLWAEGTGAPGGPIPPVPTEFGPRATELGRTDADLRARWDALLTELTAGGDVFVWGAGAKGVTFCNLVDPTGVRIRGVIDVNPAKQGRFLAGTGHPILPPVAVGGARAVLVTNPNYLSEIRAQVSALSPETQVTDPLEAILCG